MAVYSMKYLIWNNYTIFLLNKKQKYNIPNQKKSLLLPYPTKPPYPNKPAKPPAL
jgi:hypothetical protein